METYSTILVGTAYCNNGSFTATQGFSAVLGGQIVYAPAVVITSLPTVVSHVYPTVAAADLSALGSVFEWVFSLAVEIDGRLRCLRLARMCIAGRLSGVDKNKR